MCRSSRSIGGSSSKLIPLHVVKTKYNSQLLSISCPIISVCFLCTLISCKVINWIIDGFCTKHFLAFWIRIDKSTFMETALLRQCCRPYHTGAICAGFTICWQRCIFLIMSRPRPLHGLHPMHTLICPDLFTVPSVSQSLPSARIHI